jgi:hypothetical protein
VPIKEALTAELFDCPVGRPEIKADQVPDLNVRQDIFSHQVRCAPQADMKVRGDLLFRAPVPIARLRVCFRLDFDTEPEFLKRTITITKFESDEVCGFAVRQDLSTHQIAHRAQADLEMPCDLFSGPPLLFRQHRFDRQVLSHVLYFKFG